MRSRLARILSVLFLGVAALLAAAYLWYVRGAGIRPTLIPHPLFQWEVRAPMPHVRTEVAAAALNGRIYVIGGFDGFGRTTATVQVYDPARDLWSEGPPLPHPVHHAMAAAVGDRLYLIGGLQGVRLSPTDRASVLDGGRWRPIAPLPQPVGAAGIAVLDGRLHVVGGAGLGGDVTTHLVYDRAADRWQSLTPLPAARDHLAAAVREGRLYAIGGRLEGNFGANVTRVDVYDPAADRWSDGPPLGVARSGHAAVSLGPWILVFGGEHPRGTIAAVEILGEDGWESPTRLPTPRHGLGAAVVESTVYVISGGKRPALSVSGANESLTIRGEP